MVFIRDSNINYWFISVESFDLNFIEMLWNELKFFLLIVVKLRNKDELVYGIRTFWFMRVILEKC